MADPRLVSILDRTGDPATVAFAHDGTGDVTALADPALGIAAAEALGNAGVLQAVTGPKPLRKAAALALHRMRSRGVRVDVPPVAKAFSLGTERVELPARAFVSLPDPEGEIELVLTVSDEEGNCALGLVVGGTDGVREARHGHLGRGELREMWRSLESDTSHAEVPFTTGLHFADRFLRDRHNHNWTHFLEHVSPATLQSARLLDPLRGAPPARTDVEPTPWLLPTGMLDNALHEHAGELLADVAEDELGRLRAALADAAVSDRNRSRLAEMASFFAAVFTLHGRAADAEAATRVADQLTAGEAGSAIGPVSVGALKAGALELLREIEEMRATAGEEA
jgi:hypothetical protein